MMSDTLRKRCIACGGTFALSGSGRPQKLCPECRKRGMGQGWGLSASNPLNFKAAKSGFRKDLGPCVRAQIEATVASPISFTTPDGVRGRVWLGHDKNGEPIIGDE